MKKIELINFTKLSLDEKKLILSWRNHPSIKKWMYSQENIKLKTHLSFINRLSLEVDKLYFLVKEDNENIGVIDFVNITSSSVDMGIYGNPSLKGKGTILLNEIVKYSFDILKVKKINAEVFSENQRAHDLYKRFSFSDISKKMVNEREVICMELIDENR